MAADALSRISIDELRTQSGKILVVTTLGMSRTNPQEPIRADADVVRVPIYDKFSHNFSNKISKIRSELINTDDKLTALRLNIYRKFRKILYVNIRIDNETFNLDEMLSKLQELAE